MPPPISRSSSREPSLPSSVDSSPKIRPQRTYSYASDTTNRENGALRPFFIPLFDLQKERSVSPSRATQDSDSLSETESRVSSAAISRAASRPASPVQPTPEEVFSQMLVSFRRGRGEALPAPEDRPLLSPVAEGRELFSPLFMNELGEVVRLPMWPAPERGAFSFNEEKSNH